MNIAGGTVVWNLDVDDRSLVEGLSNAKTLVDKAGNEIDKKFSSMASNISSSFDKASQSLDKSANSLIAFGAAPAAAIAFATHTALTFDDRLADVAKTTGITGKNLENLGLTLRDLSKNTRTSVDELLTIAEIGGQLGIAEKDINNFTKSIDIFNVALGKDFSGGVAQATTSIGKMVSLFKETNKLDISDSINRAGSAINYLGAAGAGTTANIAEFATRLGQLPSALRPSIQDSLALGTLFEESGLSAEIAAGGMTNFFLVAGKEIDGFSKQMNISTKAARELLQQNPAEFALKFSQSLKGLDAVALSGTLGDLKIGTQETIKVVGSLGDGVDRFRALQKGANDEFKKATSLIDEYNIKNNNAAAQVDKFKNNIGDLGISLGNTFLPALNNVLKSLIPVIDRFGAFTKENPKLVSSIFLIGGGIGALGLALKGASVALSGFSVAFKGIAFISGMAKNFNLIAGSVKLVNGAFTLLAANPIILVIGSIIIIVGLLALAWKNNWGDIQGKTKKVVDFITKSIKDFSKFLEAIPKAFDNLTKKISGFFDKTSSNVSNFTQKTGNLLSGFVEIVKTDDSMNFTTALKDLGVVDTTNFFGKLAGDIREGIRKAKEIFLGILDIPNLILEGDFSGNLGRAFGLNEDSPLVLSILGFRTKVIDTFTSVVEYMKTIPQNIKDIFTEIINFIVEDFNLIKNTVLESTNFIKNTISAAFNFIKDSVIVPILEGIKNILISVWNTIVNVTSSIWNRVKEAVMGPLTSAKNTAINTIQSLFQGIQNTWNGIVSFFSNMGGRIVDAIVQPFRDAKRKIDDLANSIKESANKINPFHRNSPSLVDNVKRGVGIIADQFGSLSSLQFPSLASSAALNFSDPIDNTLKSSSSSQPVQNTSNNSQNINVNIEKVSTMQDVEMISREIGFRLQIA